MSRIPLPSSTRSTPTSPKKTPSKPAAGTPRTRPPPSPTPTPRLRPQASAKNLRSTTPTKPAGPPRAATLGRRTQPPIIKDEPPPMPKAAPLSVREQIALKRAEAQKALKVKVQTGDGEDFQGLEDASPVKEKEDMVDLGRWSVKETIERARSTGAVNLASRALPCLPSALFEIHLGVAPEPLKSVPVEPPITTATSDDPIASTSRSRANSSKGPTWFEGKDLEILKAWSNEILEIQPEISMFGSLKTVDLRNNKLITLPDTFADLMSLAILDLSHNEITSLPATLWAMPCLATLNLSYNALTALPFTSPFSPDANPSSRTVDSRGDWFSEAITRATTPLPKLSNLNVSHNEISASSIDHAPRSLPAGLTKLDISFNPLGQSASFFQALSRLVNLQELRAECANIADDSFPVDILVAGASDVQPFSHLRLLDLGQTQVTLPVLEAAFRPALVKQELEFELTAEPPKDGILRIIVGRKVVKEAWELEIERRTRLRTARHTRAESVQSNGTSAVNGTPKEATKERWEIDAEQGMLTQGAMRRARAAAAVEAASALSLPPTSSSPTQRRPQPVKESWEIEAEQGLLTEGGRRRARAQAAAFSVGTSESSASAGPTPVVSPTALSQVTITDALSSPQHYDSSAKSLTLPPSAPPSRAMHSRSFSLAPKISPSTSGTSEFSLTIPTPTLPLATILSQSFAETLHTLILSQRRMDPSFSLPADQNGPFLPQLEELRLDSCNLNNSVSICRDGAGTTRTSEPLISTITGLFPSLKSLDLSHNNLTSAALTEDILSTIILASSTGGTSLIPRVGLRHLRLRGNRITDLDSFQSVAKLFKGYKDKKDVETFKLEELDLRDNEIGKLPPELGLLPLDVLLVDGNVFRVPPRRVWEREGTKGLLGWLRGRIE